eukprot:13339418-Ditylum_brightwellii.AAC.1
MKHVGEKLLNWLYNGNICQHGYLVDSDFPLWVREEEKGLLMSRLHKKLEQIPPHIPYAAIVVVQAG